MKYVPLSLACMTYGSAIWGSLRFFRATDGGAKRGKMLISACGGLSTIVALLMIYQSPPEALQQSLLGSAAYGIALVAFWWSIRTNIRNPLEYAFSTQAPRTFVQVGPYRYVRHPFYSSYVLGWLAALILAPSVTTATIFCVMFAIYWRAMRLEERLFRSSPLAEEYQRYMTHVAPFLPIPRL